MCHCLRRTGQGGTRFGTAAVKYRALWKASSAVSIHNGQSRTRRAVAHGLIHPRIGRCGRRRWWRPGLADARWAAPVAFCGLLATGGDGRVAISTAGVVAVTEYDDVPPGRYWPGAAVNCTAAAAGAAPMLEGIAAAAVLTGGAVGIAALAAGAAAVAGVVAAMLPY